MAEESVIQDLKTAYNTEIAGYHFYTIAAAMIDDPKGRSVFTNLAKEELTHIIVVGKIADSVKSGHGWISYEDALKGASASGLPIFPKENELVKRLMTNKTDLNAVNIAMESEEAAVDFYSKLLKAAKTPVEKVVLTKLLEMEKGHLKVLRWEGESLVKSGFWCGTMEYSVEKEKD